MKNTLLFIIIILSFWSLPAQAQERPPAILTFEVTEDVIVTVNEAEQRSLEATLSWEVINFRGRYKLALDVYAVNDWITLYEDVSLRPVETVNVPLVHPLNFGPITYRLSVLNNSGEVIDQRFAQIDFTVEDEQPSISLFEVIDTSPFNEFRLNAELAWEVENRRPYTNIEFDQILPNGQIESIELPRLSLWVSSAGNGLVQPLYVVDKDEVQIRMQIVDVMDGTIYDGKMVTVSVPERPTSSAPSAPPPLIVSPTPTFPDGTEADGGSSDGSSSEGSVPPSPNSDGTKTGSLTISPQPINRSQPVNISWQVENASEVTLYAMQFITKTPQPYWTPATYIEGATVSGLNATGQIQYTIPLVIRQGTIRFRLEVLATDGDTYNIDSETINFQTFPMFNNSSVTSIFPPETSDASYQEFENGLMIWRGDTNTVFVLGHPEITGFFWRTFTGSSVNIGGNPPQGLHKPEGPFSGVWQNNTNVRALGWATGPPQSYTMQWQWNLHPLYAFQDVSYMSIPAGTIRLNYYGGGETNTGPGWAIE